MYRFLRTLFYRFAFGREFPFAGALARVFALWEGKRGERDIPVQRKQWEAEYSGGRWDYLEDADELPRYIMLAGYLRHFKEGGAVLDVGCGKGILQERLGPGAYSRYLGIDISEAALASAARRQDARTSFLRVEAESYVPEVLFDVVVFNETLCYLNEPLEVVERYIRALKDDGIVIVSSYAASERTMAVLGRLRAAYSLLDEVTVTSGTKSWICSVFQLTADRVSDSL